MHSHRVFLDSSFWIAFRDARQTHQARARECFAALFGERTHYVSTSLVSAITSGRLQSTGIRPSDRGLRPASDSQSRDPAGPRVSDPHWSLAIPEG